MEKRLQKRLLQLIAGTLAATLIVSVIFLYTVVQSVLIKNYTSNNQRFVDQISTTFETVVEQITDQSYNLIVYNTELGGVLEDMRTSIVATTGLYDILDSIVMSNRYLYSAYLYFPTTENIYGGNGVTSRIYATEWGCSFTEANFYDQEILPYFHTTHIEQSPVRMVRTIRGTTNESGNQLIFSILIPLALSQADCVLSVNVNLQSLYDDMLRKNGAAEGMELYITDTEGRIFAPANSPFYGRPVEEVFDDSKEISGDSLWVDFLTDSPMSVQSSSAIESIGWDFHLISEMQFDIDEFFDQFAATVVVLLLFLLLLVLSYIFIWRLTRPLKEAIFAYNEKVFRDILLNSDPDGESARKQLAMISQNLSGSAFSLVLIEHIGELASLSALIQQCNAGIKEKARGLDVRVIDIRPGLTVLFFIYNKEEARSFAEMRDVYLKALFRSFSEQSTTPPPRVWLSVGRQSDSLRDIPAIFNEALQMLDYKLVSRSNVIQPGNRLAGGDPVPYPLNCERQILNNMMIANAEGCFLYAQKFLDTILSRENFLPDTLIESYAYQLQNAVLREITSLPISIKLYQEDAKPHFYQASDIEEWLMGFLRTILDEISRKNARDENILEDSIFQYIRENLCDNDFNLNTMSDQLSMNRNYLARLIKEKTGKTFNDYVNHQRVQLAKELLKDHALTVEAISHRVGFAYAHYFIKTFKGIEGITPGQYRKMMDDNKNAQE
ncbi:MAG TPA: AraC family transcriptional regulator [Candidatus Merdivicinus faecavium]|nr:AraC family transcriptional regulator [Candidatus Merdivicinus faecavium]